MFISQCHLVPYLETGLCKDGNELDNCDFTDALPTYRSFWGYNCKAYEYKTFRFIYMLQLYIEPPSYCIPCIRDEYFSNTYTTFGHMTNYYTKCTCTSCAPTMRLFDPKMFSTLLHSFTEHTSSVKKDLFYHLKMPRPISKLINQFLGVCQLTFTDFEILTSQRTHINNIEGSGTC